MIYRAGFALLVVLAALSCRETVTLPPVQGPPLSIPERGSALLGAEAAARPLEVIHVSPAGQLTSPHLQITVSFSKPMVSLERVEDRARLSPLEITPAVAGEQRWLGSRTLTLQIKDPLPGSTTFSLRVPRGLKALDGSTLEQERAWTFTTPRLQVAQVVPRRGERWQLPDTRVQLFFNQPVDPAAVEKQARFVVRQREVRSAELVEIPARVKRGRDAKHLVVHPARSLPLAASVTLRLDEALTGLEGPLPMGAVYTTEFSTYGPFRIERLSCTTCDPEDSVRIVFSNPVPQLQARRATRLNGKQLAGGRSTYASTTVYLGEVKLRARARYAVAVEPTLQDKFGQPLQGKTTLAFATRDFDPYVSLPLPSGVLEASAPRSLPIYFRNASAAKLLGKRLTPAEVARLLGHGEYWERDKLLLASFDGVQTRELRLPQRPNIKQVKRVDLTALMGGEKRGVLAVELESRLKQPGEKAAEVSVQRAVVRITDLGITAKYSPHTTLVWVTSLSSGRPVPGCTVSLFRPKETTPIWRGQTDGQGLAVAPGASKLGTKEDSHRFIYFVEKDGDQSYVLSSTQSGISAWDFGYDATWEDEVEGALGMIFSDRGIYRPGEEVHLKGILRQTGERGLITPSGDRVKLTVSDARGEKLLQAERVLSDFGSFALAVKLPPGAPLGSYSVVGKPRGGGTLYGSFAVEEYRPAEFKVAVKSERRELVRGESMAWSVSGDYLFGAPMRGAALSWNLYSSDASFAPPAHEGFVFADEVRWWGDDEERSTTGFVGRGKGKLDERGQAAGTRVLRPARMNGPQSHTLEVTVTDVSRQTIASRTTVLLHPGEFYLGARPQETFLTAGKPLEAEIVAATPRGKRLAGVKVQGTLYRRTWSSVRKQGMGGAHTFVTRPVETPAGSCQVVTADRPRPCTIPVPQAGYYVLRLRGEDKRRNPLQTSFGVYVTGSDYVAWRRDNESRLELVTDRKSYKVGQVARILIKSPFAGAHGLFTVERNGVYTRRPFKLDKTAAWMEVPITEELIPNAYVSVVLVRGRTAPARPPGKGKKDAAGKEEDDDEDTPEDPHQPTFKVGYAKLTISQVKRQLGVTVTPARAEYRPGEEIVVDLGVRDAGGKGIPAELTVFAADEGVLSLIGYRTPDPMAVFYAERGLSVRTADNRIQLINQRVLGEKGSNAGGGGAGEGSGGDGVRRNFVSTPYFNPRVLTDERGRAQIRFKLPDNLTTYRLMAVAASRGADFGSAQSTVKVNKPLLLLHALPRLVRVGDRIEAGVVVHNQSKAGGEVRVQASVTGLQLEGPATRSVTVRDGGSAEARFRFSALHPGKATFRFVATLAEQEDRLELKREVVLPMVVESVATFGSTERAIAEGFVPSQGVRQDVGGLEVALSSSALVGLKPSMEYLIDYPYGCLEQLTSRLVPLVLLRDLATAFKIRGPQDEAAGALIGQLIGKIERLQRWDGGFSFWSSDYQSSPWVSAYAAWGLTQARQNGHAASKQVLEKAKGYLRRQLNAREPKGEEAMVRSLKAFVAHVLAAMGERPTAALSRLFEQRASLPLFGRALLLSALARAKGDRELIATLTREITSSVHQTAKSARVEENLGDGYAPFFHSDDRSSALVLEALLASQPEHPLTEKLVRHLLEVRRHGRWRNTQETVYALLALQRYYQVREKEVPDFVARVLLGEAQLLEQTFRGRSLAVQEKTVPMRQLLGRRGQLGFVKEGRGRLYYSARLRYARSVLPKEPWDEGFYVTRTYERVPEEATSFASLRGERESQGPGVLKVRAGDLVRVILRVVAPQQLHFVALEDPLPAGLEAVNFRLMTAARALGHEARPFAFDPRHSHRRYASSWSTPFHHQELRDDRVQLFADVLPPGVHTYVYLTRATTIGTFVAAPTQVEQMYAPEVFGRSGSATFEVTAK